MSVFIYRFLFCRPNVGEFDFLMYAIIDFIFISVHYKFYSVLPFTIPTTRSDAFFYSVEFYYRQKNTV